MADVGNFFDCAGICMRHRRRLVNAANCLLGISGGGTGRTFPNYFLHTPLALEATLKASAERSEDDNHQNREEI